MRKRLLQIEISANDKYCDDVTGQCGFVRRQKPDWSYKCVLFRGPDGKGLPLREKGPEEELGRCEACLKCERSEST